VDVPISLSVDGQDRRLSVDPRVTLLDALRDHLGVMSPKRAVITASAAPALSWPTAGACWPA
jgi:aerobic-type carbon monoxide dehydrogenase small subunit (CoxS/CutS family)